MVVIIVWGGDLISSVFCKPLWVFLSNLFVVCHLLKPVDVRQMVSVVELLPGAWFGMYVAGSPYSLCMTAKGGGSTVAVH